MAKEQERDELHRTIWQIANDLRGSVDGWDFKDNTIDAFGDAYEFLMTMYASSAGKSGGEFFTPQEMNIQALNARIAGIVLHQKELRAYNDEIVADLEGGTR